MKKPAHAIATIRMKLEVPKSFKLRVSRDKRTGKYHLIVYATK